MHIMCGLCQRMSSVCRSIRPTVRLSGVTLMYCDRVSLVTSSNKPGISALRRNNFSDLVYKENTLKSGVEQRWVGKNGDFQQ